MKTLCGAVVVGVLALGLTTARGSAQQDAQRLPVPPILQSYKP